MIEKGREIRVKAVGERIKSLRISAGYSSNVDFAFKKNIDRKNYWRLEAGKANFTINTLLRILEIHDLTLEEFFKDLK